MPGEHGIELLVQRVAHKIARTLPPSVQIEDLFQSGMIGWTIAKKKYQDSFKIPFNNFAVIYIRGAIIDSLREGSWAPRSVCRYQRLINEARQELDDKGVREPSDGQIAEHLGISLNKYNKIAADLVNIYFKELNLDIEGMVSEEDTYAEAENEIVREKLNKILQALPVLSQAIIKMHYDEDISIPSIAGKFAISECEARKILRQALAKLRAVLGESNARR